MIVQINNSTNYGCNMDTLKYLSHNYYPEQDIEKLDKLVLLRCKFDGIVNNRFFIDKIKYPEYEYDNSGAYTFLLILRYDKVEPFRVILMSSLGRIIVSDKNTIESMIYPPEYIPRSNCDNVSIFKDKAEISFRNAGSYYEFIDLYKNEFIHQYKPQDETILGNVCFTEYYQDIMKTDSSTNILSPSREKAFNEIKEELIRGNKDLDVLPDEILKSFPLYYNRRGQSYVDKPLRVVNSGTIIRADSNSDGELVVAENVGDKLRFITGKEAFIYTEYEERTERYPEYSNVELINGNIYTGEDE